MLPQIDGYCLHDQDLWEESSFELGTPINLFTQWSSVPLDEGFVVLLPAKWKLTAAQAVSKAYRHVQLNPVNLSEEQYLLSSSEPLWGDYDLILQILTDQSSGFQNYRVAVAPAIKIGSNYIANESFVHYSELRAKSGTGSGTVLAFKENTAPVHIQSHWLEALTHSHTLEFWIQTTALNAVTLSAWNGEEENLYPIEIVVDARGRIRYYRNTTGHHITLSTESAIADGNWHHISVTYDSETYWTKFYLDGQVADSLLDPSGSYLRGNYPVALGGRVGVKESQHINQFTGKIDNLRLWPSVRNSTQINAPMRQTTDDEAVVIDFESANSFKYFEEKYVADYYAPGGPTSDLLANEFRGMAFDQGVMLTWTNEDLRATAFLIERSEDGIRFDEIARIEQSHQGTQWSYTDPETTGRIVFYRLIQELEGQPSQISGVIKLGLGPEILPPSAEILGNYPNPFNPQTLITYEVREPQHLQLSIINLSGLIVAVLSDHFHENGVFEVSWDGTEISSGIYFVRLRGQDGMTQTRQILLAK